MGGLLVQIAPSNLLYSLMNSISSNISKATYRNCLLAVCAGVFSAVPSYGSDAATKQTGKPEAVNEQKQAAANDENLSAERIQCLVMDFSDQYTADICAALDEYLSIEPDASKRAAAQYWKVRYGAAAMAIAASRDPRTSLLDMVVFISAGRWVVDSYWIPKVFGKNSAKLSDVYDRMDEKIWSLAGRVLSVKQKLDLHDLIKTWERNNPRRHDVTDVRLLNLDGVHLSAFDDGLAARGIVAGVRKILNKVDSSLLYGERVMFCLERTPRILSLQTELTLSQIGDAFPIATVKPEALASAVKEVPGILQEAIDRNEGSIKTLQSANTLASSLNKTLTSVRELTEKNGDSPLLHADPVALLKDANQALAHLDSSISGLNRILEKSAAGQLQADELSRRIEGQAGHLMDATFHRILILIGAFFAGVALILLLAKRLFKRT